MRSTLLLAASIAALASAADAQVYARARSGSDDDRAALGVNTSTSRTKRDTLGLLITSVVPGSPAEKAGLEEGNRIQSINGVSLRLAAADAGERDMDGVMTNRLVRELRKMNAGDEADLRVYAAGQVKTVKVKTTHVEDLNTLERRATRVLRDDDDLDERAVVGFTFGGGSSKRDSLGVFVATVKEGGPAEKAGILEGARIAAINGVDLRVAKEDAGDSYMASAKANRFRRIMRDVKPGDNVELRVYMNGQTRAVTVKTGSYADVYGKEGNQTFFFGEGGFGGNIDIRMPRIEVAPPAPPRAPLLPGRVRILDEQRAEIESQLRRASSALDRTEQARQRAMEAEMRAREASRRAIRSVSM